MSDDDGSTPRLFKEIAQSKTKGVTRGLTAMSQHSEDTDSKTRVNPTSRLIKLIWHRGGNFLGKKERQITKVRPSDALAQL